MRARWLVPLVPVIIVVLNASAVGQSNPPVDADLTDDMLEAEGDFHGNGPPPDVPATPVDVRLEPYTQRVVADFHLNETCGDEGQVVGLVRYVEVDPGAGTRIVLFETFECVDLPSPDDPTTGDLPPPRLVDIHERVSERLPLPRVNIDPLVDGLTGLETFFWHDDNATTVDHDGDATTPAVPGVEVTATAGPYSITARAWVVEYRWETGDGATYRSATPGTHEHPAAIHVYDVKGGYVVVAETVWSGSYTWTATDGTTGTGDLGTVTRRDTRDYRVIEVRAVLVG